MQLLIIIPTHNEEHTIGKLIKTILNEYCMDYNCSILVVDDASYDGTRGIVDKLACEDKFKDKLFIIKREAKLGLASAYLEGFEFGLRRGFDGFIQMDGDLSHNPCYLKDIFEYLKDNDVVIGSRNIAGGRVVGWSFIRNFISKGGSLYSRLILNCPIKDLTGGFNGYRREILDKIRLNSIISKGYSFQIEMKYKAYKANAQIKEFPIVFEDRKFGKSKMSSRIFFEALFNIIKIRINS